MKSRKKQELSLLNRDKKQDAGRLCLISCFLILASSSAVFPQGICNCFFQLDSTFQVVPMTVGPDSSDVGVPPDYLNNDASTPPIILPFTFCFYGQNYDTVYINNNGNISFTKPVFRFSPDSFPLGGDTMMIAPFYSDVNTITSFSGPVYYKITPTNMAVIWDYVGYQSTDDDAYNNFEMVITNGADPILPAGNNVAFCYPDMEWACSDASGGFAGYDGIPATTGINRGNGTDYAQFGTYSVPGGTFYGPYAAYNGLQWLDSKTIIFNTCVTGGIISPAILESNQTLIHELNQPLNPEAEPICNGLTVCAGSSLAITSTFICSQYGQTCTLSATCPGVTGLSIIDTSTVNGVDSITIQLTPAAADTGVHTLNIMATDNNSLVTTLSYVITVKICSGINEINSNNNFSVYPNPGNGKFTVEISPQQSPFNNMLKIYDILGNNIFSIKPNSDKTEINLSGISAGIYFLEFYSDNAPVGVKKIVIE